MKENIDIMAGLFGMFGALMKSLKKKFTNREVIINTIIGGVLSFGIMFVLITYLPRWVKDDRVVLFFAFFGGWIANDFTDKLEKSIGDFYDILISYFKKKNP
jgi:hypothetical protein